MDRKLSEDINVIRENDDMVGSMNWIPGGAKEKLELGY